MSRRVYTSRQLEHAADATRSLLAEADAVRGLRITYEARCSAISPRAFEHV